MGINAARGQGGDTKEHHAESNTVTLWDTKSVTSKGAPQFLSCWCTKLYPQRRMGCVTMEAYRGGEDDQTGQVSHPPYRLPPGLCLVAG